MYISQGFIPAGSECEAFLKSYVYKLGEAPVETLENDLWVPSLSTPISGHSTYFIRCLTSGTVESVANSHIRRH